MGKSFLYIIAALFIILWVIGFFFYGAGALVHILLLLALISVLLRILLGGNYNN